MTIDASYNLNNEKSSSMTLKHHLTTSSSLLCFLKIHSPVTTGFVLCPSSWTDHYHGRQSLLETEHVLSLIRLLLLHQQSHPACTLAFQAYFLSTSTTLKSTLPELIQVLYNTLLGVVVNVTDVA